MGTPYKLTPDRVDEFFSLLAQAHSVKYACKMIGVSPVARGHIGLGSALLHRRSPARSFKLKTIAQALCRGKAGAYSGTTAIVSISTSAAGSTSRETSTSAIAG